MSAQGFRFHALAYFGAIAVAELVLLSVALTTGGWFGVAAGVGVSVLLVPFAAPAAALSLATILGQPRLSRQRQWLLTTLVFGVSTLAIAWIYSEARLNGPYDDKPGLPALGVLFALPAAVAGNVFGRFESSRFAPRRHAGAPA